MNARHNMAPVFAAHAALAKARAECFGARAVVTASRIDGVSHADIKRLVKTRATGMRWTSKSRHRVVLKFLQKAECIGIMHVSGISAGGSSVKQYRTDIQVRHAILSSNRA